MTDVLTLMRRDPSLARLIMNGVTATDDENEPEIECIELSSDDDDDNNNDVNDIIEKYCEIETVDPRTVLIDESDQSADTSAPGPSSTSQQQVETQPVQSSSSKPARRSAKAATDAIQCGYLVERHYNNFVGNITQPKKICRKKLRLQQQQQQRLAQSNQATDPNSESDSNPVLQAIANSRNRALTYYEPDVDEYLAKLAASQGKVYVPPGKKSPVKPETTGSNNKVVHGRHRARNIVPPLAKPTATKPDSQPVVPSSSGQNSVKRPAPKSSTTKPLPEKVIPPKPPRLMTREERLAYQRERSRVYYHSLSPEAKARRVAQIREWAKQRNGKQHSKESRRTTKTPTPTISTSFQTTTPPKLPSNTSVSSPETTSSPTPTSSPPKTETFNPKLFSFGKIRKVEPLYGVDAEWDRLLLAQTVSTLTTTRSGRKCKPKFYD